MIAELALATTLHAGAAHTHSTPVKKAPTFSLGTPPALPAKEKVHVQVYANMGCTVYVKITRTHNGYRLDLSLTKPR